MQYRVIEIHNRPSTDERGGALSFFEGERDIPFEIRRIYYIYGVKSGGHRGDHAHKTLQQLIFCPYGRIEMTFDDGKTREKVMLDHPAKGIIVEPGLWREMDWVDDDSVLCVAASDFYSEDDYIRDYNTFLDYINTVR